MNFITLSPEHERFEELLPSDSDFMITKRESEPEAMNDRERLIEIVAKAFDPAAYELRGVPSDLALCSRQAVVEAKIRDVLAAAEAAGFLIVSPGDGR